MKRTELKRKTPLARGTRPLKSKRKPRPMKPEAMDELVLEVMVRDGRCVAIDHTETMCDGYTEAHHLISQRRIRKDYGGVERQEVLADKRNAVALCQRHHDNVERSLLHLPAEALPKDFPDFLRERGYEAVWDGEIERRAA